MNYVPLMMTMFLMLVFLVFIGAQQGMFGEDEPTWGSKRDIVIEEYYADNL